MVVPVVIVVVVFVVFDVIVVVVVVVGVSLIKGNSPTDDHGCISPVS